jgi:hypothetical protein
MPNMTEGWAIVIAAFISVGGIVITVITNLIFNSRQINTGKKERLFYEIYAKRLAVYEDVINILDEMGNDESSFLQINITDEEVFKKINDGMHTLWTLHSRLTLYGSTRSRAAIDLFLVEGHSMLCEFYDGSQERGIAIAQWFSTIKEKLVDFTDIVSGETKTKLIDRIIDEYGDFISKKKIKKKGNSNPH